MTTSRRYRSSLLDGKLLRLSDNGCRNVFDTGQREERTQHRHPLQEYQHRREKGAKQRDEPIPFHQQPEKRPSIQHQQQPKDEAKRPALIPRSHEKLHRLLWSNRQRHPRQKHQVPHRQQPSVEEKQHPEHGKSAPKARQTDSNLCANHQRTPFARDGSCPSGQSMCPNAHDERMHFSSVVALRPSSFVRHRIESHRIHHALFLSSISLDVCDQLHPSSLPSRRVAFTRQASSQTFVPSVKRTFQRSKCPIFTP